MTIGQMCSNSDCMSNLHVSQTDVQLLTCFSQLIAEFYIQPQQYTKIFQSKNGIGFWSAVG